MPSFVEYPTTKWIKPTRDSNNNFDFSPCDEQLARDYVQGSIIQPVRVMASAGASAPETKITDGTDTLLINSDGTLNIQIVEKELTPLYATSTATETKTIGTVPAGKVWKVYALQLASRWDVLTGTGGINTNLSLQGVVCLSAPLNSYNAQGMAICSSQISFGNNYIKLTAGQTATFNNNADVTTDATIFYVEESA